MYLDILFFVCSKSLYTYMSIYIHLYNLIRLRRFASCQTSSFLANETLQVASPNIPSVLQISKLVTSHFSPLDPYSSYASQHLFNVPTRHIYIVS